MLRRLPALLSALLGAALVLGQEPAAAGAQAAFDFARPVRSLLLPPILKEVSALAAVDDRTVACLQDEHGILFTIDLEQGSLRSARRFGGDGDYEGLARVGEDWFVLRSDGLLLRLRPEGTGFAVTSFPLALPQRDAEGLAWDASRRLLLVAPKEVPRGDKEDRDPRALFGFDPERGLLLPDPVLVVRRSEVLQRAGVLGLEVPVEVTERGKERPDLQLRIAEVALQPGTGDLYLLSAADRALLVLDREGRLRSLHCFAEQELPKPEGLAFLPGGDLVIASEGVEGPAVIRRYRARAGR